MGQRQLLLIAFTTICIFGMADAGIIGINWGRKTSHRLIPSMVVDIMLQNNISSLKIFSPEVKAMVPFIGTNISVSLTMPNTNLDFVLVPNMARYYLNQHVRRFKTLGVNVKSLCLGTNITLPQNTTFYESAVMAMSAIKHNIIVNEHEYLIATMLHTIDVLTPITKPSESSFNLWYNDKVIEMLSIIKGTKFTFSISFLPLEFVLTHQMPVEFAFMDNKSNFTIQDGDHVYTNAFELVYDSFVTALTKAGAPDVDIVVSQIGWPTDGHPAASASNAQRFYKKFLPYIKSNKGTPLRPGASIEIYISNLADENTAGISNNRSYSRHYGIYKSNGEPKYKIDLSGECRDIYPTVARGTASMPKRWCVFNGDKSNMEKVRQQFDIACKKADCTPLFPGGSCSNLTFDQNVSYAFNNLFQMGSQYNSEGSSCDFDGLGAVVPYDPSVGTCDFLVEILGADLRDNGGLRMSMSSRLRAPPCFRSMLLPLIGISWFALQL